MIGPAIDWYRLGAGEVDCNRRGQHCVGAENDLVASFDARCQHRNLQAVGRIADSKDMAYSEERCQALLEHLKVYLFDESSPVSDVAEYLLEFCLLRRKESGVVEEWNAAHDA
jgi:hypothetical protein